MSSPVFVVLTRAGKRAQTVEATVGSTLEDSLLKAGFSPDDYRGWSFQGPDGESMSLGSVITETIHVICGARVDGAIAA